MNQDVKPLWLEALRSGEYEQCTTRLRLNDSFCCLGVLCDLFVKKQINEDAFWGKQIDEQDGTPFEIEGKHRIWTAGLPDVVIKWAGVDSDFVYVDTPDGRSSLAFLNDEGKTFAEIADIIERYL